MNPEMIKALQEMQAAGWGVGGKLAEESDEIETNHELGEYI